MAIVKIGGNIYEPPTFTVPAKVLWLDAPTCEGWWWYRSNVDGETWIIHVEPNESGKLWCDESLVMPEEMPGRWFGPLVPPEG